MADPLASRYAQNPDYQPQEGSAYRLLVDARGWGVACDELVFRLWSGFDGRPTDQVLASVCGETAASTALVESTAKVLARAGVLIPNEPLGPWGRHTPAHLAALGESPQVSVIVLAGRQARSHLETCLPSVLAQSYANLEVILVDNYTTDDSADFARTHFPQIRVLPTGEPLGFDAANNRGMKEAQGAFLFLLNDDTELEPDCIAECMKVMGQSDRIACVVPKMKLFYMRGFLNSIGNSLYPDGLSCDNFVGYLDVGQFDHVEEVFSACFGGALLRGSAIQDIGYLDEGYSFYYEDMDWSYRARLRGYKITTAPQAIVYHKFNATMQTLSSTFKLGLVARNRLRFIWKNLDRARAWRLTRIYLTESLRHAAWATGQGHKGVVSTYLRSWGQWLGSWPELLRARRQNRGRRHPGFSDDAAFALVDQIPRPTMYDRYPVLSAAAVQDHYMHLEIFQPGR